MKLNSIITFLVVLIVVSSVVLVINKNSDAQSVKKQFLSENVYIDPKGFFKIRPPEGWQVQEFTNDPRGKVKFSCPDAYNTVLQVIGMVSSFSNFEELVRDGEASAERLKVKLNASISIERISFTEVPAVKMFVTIPGKLKQEQIQFLLGKNHGNVL